MHFFLFLFLPSVAGEGIGESVEYILLILVTGQQVSGFTSNFYVVITSFVAVMERTRMLVSRHFLIFVEYSFLCIVTSNVTVPLNDLDSWRKPNSLSPSCT